MLASQLLRVAFQWVDALWVRGLGVDATAAVTTSVFVMWTVYSLQDVFGIGAAAYVSQLLGAGDRARAGVAAYKGLRAAAVIGVLCAIAGSLGAGKIYASDARAARCRGGRPALPVGVDWWRRRSRSWR